MYNFSSGAELEISLLSSREWQLRNDTRRILNKLATQDSRPRWKADLLIGSEIDRCNSAARQLRADIDRLKIYGRSNTTPFQYHSPISATLQLRLVEKHLTGTEQALRQAESQLRFGDS